jgi:DNA invertase Pin-like site-specific DNA recombinase
VYLETQRRLWPKLVEARLLPEPGQEQTVRSADHFTRRFVDRIAQPFVSAPVPKLWDALGTSYVRYSSSHQNPRSLDDQLVIQLNRARTENIFIPWEYVFGDAGVSGKVSNRAGYRLAKQVLALEGPGAVEIIFIDEIARATRDGIETLLLGNLVQTLGKRMIGCSDGFDSREEFSKMKLHFFAMFNEQFLTQHRAKVMRGKHGALRRGTVQGKTALGIIAVPATDERGTPLRTRNGVQANTFAIDDKTRPVVDLLAQRFVDERRSLYSIAKEFNGIRAANRTSWAAGVLKDILQNKIYLGIYIFGRTQHIVDPITGKIKIVEKPQKEWKVKRYRNIQIWSLKRWKQIQARIKETEHLTTPKRKWSRNTVYPTTLLSGTMFCGYCGNELRLYKSNKKKGYKQFWCSNGRPGTHGCKLCNTKSVKVIEDSVLRYVRAQVLIPDRIRELVETVNKVLCDEAVKPRLDTKGLQRALADLKRKRERLIDLIADSVSPDLVAARGRIAHLENQIGEISRQIREAQTANAAKVPPVDLDRTLSLLNDLRGLLNQDVASAAPALRKMLGKLWIRREQDDPKCKGWVATFRGNLIPFVADFAATRADCPDSYSWVNLRSRIWTSAPEKSFTITEITPVYQVWAENVATLVNSGMSISAAARTLAINRENASLGYHFSQDGLNRRERYRLTRPKARIDKT